MASLAKLRTRWAAIGAACAVTLGGSTIGIVQASVSSGDRAIYVPISPVRVLDTRSDVGVATVQDATPALLTVTGTIATTTGQQNVVPTGASSVVINVTAINPTSDGFVSLRPGDATGAPAVSTLNVTVGGTFPNGATITLPTSGGSAGQIQIWYEAYAATGGTTDLLIDVVGYYTNHNHDDRYYTETEVDTALASKADASELASKANSSDVNTAIAGKANTSDVNTAIAGKANTSDLTSGLASKASVSDVNTAIAGKANTTDLFHPILPSTQRTVDAEGNVGYQTSIAIGTDGNPIISYLDLANGDLKTASCESTSCNNATISTVDSIGNVGTSSSIAIGANGNPIISYYDFTNRALKIAACSNPKCTDATISTIDSNNGDVGQYSSIAIGANGNPIISYFDATSYALKVASCDNPVCTTAHTTRFADNGNVGFHSSIAIGSDGRPVISYYDATNEDLKLAACDSFTCSSAHRYTIDTTGNVGEDTSIAIGTDGNPIISYLDRSNYNLKIAHCGHSRCDPNALNTVINSYYVMNVSGFYTSIAIGVDGYPVVAYVDSNLNQVKILHCTDLSCLNGNINIVDDDMGGTVQYTSLAIGADGVPVVSYQDGSSGDVKLASAWWMAGGR